MDTFNSRNTVSLNKLLYGIFQIMFARPKKRAVELHVSGFVRHRAEIRQLRNFPHKLSHPAF